MAHEWKVGDLALCIKIGEWTGAVSGRPWNAGSVRAGGIYTVSHIGPGFSCPVALKFIGEPARRYDARRFRKVTPPAADDFDRETIELMNRKPVGEVA